MKLDYRPEIDGLRALAVLAVILFHAGFSSFSGGFVGVDVFFVISGYLITSIISGGVAAGTFSYLDFYERRVRRILPALLLVMACCLPFAWLWMMPFELKAFSNTLVSVMVSASNIRLWQLSGYFDAPGDLMPLLHTWSLAVEEQFYLVFPMLLVALLRRGRRQAAWLLAALLALSAGLSIFAAAYHPSFNFYWLPTRAWELLAGALCAFAAIKPQPTRDTLVSVVGVAALAVPVLAWNKSIPFPMVLPVAGTCAVLLFARSDSIVGRCLSLRPLVGLGLISYSAYLWHQPLFAFARLRWLSEPPWPLMLALSAATFCLAYFSWRLVEVPARRRGAWPLPGRRATFAACGVLAVVLAAAGLAGHISRGAPWRLPKATNDIAAFANDRNPRGPECLGAKPDSSCIYGDARAVHVALLGDSHADAIANELGKALGRHGHGLRELTHSGCPPLPDYRWGNGNTVFECGNYYREVVRFLAAHSEIDTVVIFARWPMYFEFSVFDNGEGGVEEGGRVFPHGLGGNGNDPAKMKERLGNLLTRSISELRALNKKVLLIYPQPEMGWSVPRYLASALFVGARITRPLSTSLDVFRARTESSYQALDAVGTIGVARVYPEEIFCDTFAKGRCAAEDGSKPFYFDDDHVNSIGAAMISNAVVSRLAEQGWLKK